MLVSVGCSSAQLGRSYDHLAGVYYDVDYVSDASCSSSTDDNEHAFFLQAEKRVARLEAIRPQSDACKRKLHQLKALCEQNTVVRLQIAYESLLNRLEALDLEAQQVVNDQSTVVEQQEIGQEQRSRLECLESFAQWLRALVEKWTRLAANISANRWFRRTLPVRIAEYRRKSILFTTMAVSTLRTTNAMLDNGVAVLALQKPYQITEQFLVRFTDALNDLNVTVRLIRRLAVDDYTLLPSVPSEVSLTKLLNQLAAASGASLSAQVAEAQAPYLRDDDELGEMTIIEAEQQMSKMFTTARSVKSEIQQETIHSQSREITSDYSSASSHGSTTTADLSAPHSPSKLHQLPSIKRLMQQLYTLFLEQRYSLFVALVDAASRHKSLNADFKPHSWRQQQQQRGVVWLDDCLRSQRRKLWKRYVQSIWEIFQDKLVDSVVPALLSRSPAGLVHISQCLNEILLSVPLPQHVASRGVLSSRLLAIARHRLFVHGIGAISMAVATNHINEQQVQLARLILDQSADGIARSLLADHLIAITRSRANDFLAQYDMNSFFTFRFIFHAIVTMDEEPWLTKNILTSIVREKTVSTLMTILPPKEFWLSSGDETSGYVERLMIHVLEPISFASAKIPMQFRLPICQMAVDQMVVSWMRYFLDNDIKLSCRGACKLQTNLLEAELWITCNYVFKSVDLTALHTAVASVKTLETKRRHSSVVSFTKNQVGPRRANGTLKDGPS
uniref:Uncharacterized protein n=1 Tax=Plectus sambesii TaxID=2011161 RepID=A0A914WGI0_9BILA